MGSVKDIEILISPERDKAGTGRFHFSDRYSVFDWGEMPDQIPGKGASIAILSGYFFEKLAGMGIKTHYIGLVEDGESRKLKELKVPSDIMEINLVRVLKPLCRDDRYDYAEYGKEEGGNLLIPLEIIYRNSLPEGSSLLKRLRSGESSLEEFGLSEMPSPGDSFKEPLLDVSTKLEITDRYLSWSEAARIAALTETALAEIRKITFTVNRMITDEFSRIGLRNEDGKIELGLDPAGEIMLVDVLGTLDECRFTYNGIPVSKEIARIHYRDTEWHRAVEDAKKRERMQWKELVTKGPEPLPARLKELISQVYAACTNEITGREWFKNTPSIGLILEELKDFVG